jgi:hypothetical protein
MMGNNGSLNFRPPFLTRKGNLWLSTAKIKKPKAIRGINADI